MQARRNERWGEQQERFRGVIQTRARAVLHQPLKRTILRKNSVFGQNMNGVPVCLSRKTENAPTQRPQNGLFGTPVWAYISPVSGLHTTPFVSSPASSTSVVLDFLFYFFSSDNYFGTAIPNYKTIPEN